MCAACVKKNSYRPATSLRLDPGTTYIVFTKKVKEKTRKAKRPAPSGTRCTLTCETHANPWGSGLACVLGATLAWIQANVGRVTLTWVGMLACGRVGGTLTWLGTSWRAIGPHADVGGHVGAACDDRARH